MNSSRDCVGVMNGDCAASQVAHGSDSASGLASPLQQTPRDSNPEPADLRVWWRSAGQRPGRRLSWRFASPRIPSFRNVFPVDDGFRLGPPSAVRATEPAVRA